jgi:hypothetical protein
VTLIKVFATDPRRLPRLSQLSWNFGWRSPT